MALTKSDIIEIQTAAKFNHLRRLREMEEKEELKKQVAEAVAEAKAAPAPSEQLKKGK